MGKIQPTILQETVSEEGWNDEIHGHVLWRTLFSSERTPTEGLTAGVAKILPGNELKSHRHAEPEIYYIIEGRGVVTINGVEYQVYAGASVFIPRDFPHSVENREQNPFRFLYVFPVDSFNDVNYIFSEM